MKLKDILDNILKYYILIFLLFFLVGCQSKEKPISVKKINEVKEEKYVDNNPIIVGLYENDLTLVKDYYVSKKNNKEIIFSVYYTNDKILDNNNQKYNWNKYYNNYFNIDNYKIGFSFSFYSSENELIKKIILGPDIFAFESYFYIYLYDDINQPDGVFYSHLEHNNITDSTILSSIKLYFVNVDAIKSPIELTVFTYNDLNDFDENNNYRGNSKYTITINLVK